MTKLCLVVRNTKRMRLNKNRTLSSVFQYGRESLLNMGTQNIRSRKVQILVKQSAE